MHTHAHISASAVCLVCVWGRHSGGGGARGALCRFKLSRKPASSSLSSSRCAGTNLNNPTTTTTTAQHKGPSVGGREERERSRKNTKTCLSSFASNCGQKVRGKRQRQNGKSNGKGKLAKTNKIWVKFYFRCRFAAVLGRQLAASRSLARMHTQCERNGTVEQQRQQQQRMRAADCPAESQQQAHHPQL